MIVRSLRARIMLWFGLILLLAMSLLGFVLHHEMEESVLRDADSRLDLWQETVDHKLEEYPETQWRQKLEAALPADVVVTVWNGAGAVVSVEDAVTSATLPESARNWTADHWRLQERGSAKGSWTRLGLDITADMDRVDRFLVVLLFALGGVLAVALLGGWVVVTRTLRPIEGMTATARRISADHLNERIETEELPEELIGLATTLNASFAELEAAFERQARFTADASHELRTPLSIVHAHLELALAEKKIPDALRERVRASFDAAQRMRSVVEGLLTLARADAAGSELSLAPFDLARLAEEVVSSCAPLAARAGHRLDMSVNPVWVSGDESRLRDAVTNLVLNAVRHHGGEGQIDVTVERKGERAVLRVRDDGVGISEKDQARIFERFYRVDKARSRAEGGSGLGLAITRWVVEAHEGCLDVLSETGGGSQFTIELAAIPDS